MHRNVVTSVAIAALALAAPMKSARAQEKGVELGVGMLTWAQLSCSGCSSTNTIMTGGGYVLAGFYLNPMIALEPRLSVSSTSGGGSNLTIWGISLGVPFYFAKTWGHNGWFVEPSIGYRTVSATGASSLNQTTFGAEIGGKVPLNKDAAMRIGGFYEYGNKSGSYPQTNTFGIEFGLSAFLK
jgi:hypothetical protein